jgi:hypothetical protein
MLTDEQIRQHTKARVAAARTAVHEAQDALGRACRMLSPLEYGSPTHKRASKLYDQVHALWYKVDGLYENPKVRLDRRNIEAIEKQLEDEPHRRPQLG